MARGKDKENRKKQRKASRGDASNGPATTADPRLVAAFVGVASIFAALALSGGPGEPPGLGGAPRSRRSSGRRGELPYGGVKPDCRLDVQSARVIMAEMFEVMRVDRDAAFGQLDQVIECGPVNVEEVMMNTGTWRASGGDFDEAAKIFDAMWASGGAQRSDMVDGGALDAYVDSLTALGRLGDVVAVVSKALAQPTENDDPDDLAATLCLAQAQLGLPADGLAFLPESSAGGVSGGAGVTILQSVDADGDATRSGFLGAVCRGNAALVAGDSDRAADLFATVLELASGSVAEVALAKSGHLDYVASEMRARSGVAAPEAVVTDYDGAALGGRAAAGGWARPAFYVGPCDIDRRASLTPDEFISEYAARGKPVLLKGPVDDWDAFSQWTRDRFLADYGDELVGVHETSEDSVRLAHSVAGWFEPPDGVAPLRDFVDAYMGQQHVEGEAPYVWGPPPAGLGRAYDAYLDGLFRESEIHDIAEPERGPLTAFSLGGAGSGGAFHTRGAHHTALIFGATQWFLFPPVSYVPPGGVVGFAAALEADGGWAPPRPRTCVQQPGELLYVPTGWHSAHVNLGDTLAVNTQVATPTHMPLKRDVERRTDADGNVYEVNAKTGEVVYVDGAAAAYASDDDDDDF